MIRKRTLIFVIIFILTGFLGVWLYKPIRATVACNNILSIPPSFRYTKSGFRDCMRSTGTPGYFAEIYIQVKDLVELNKEGIETIKQYYKDN